MSQLTRRLLSLAVAAACAGPALAADSDDSVTIYSSLQPGAVAPELYRPVAGQTWYGPVPGYAIVRHERSYDIQRGLNPLRVTDVAALIDPTTVTFTSLTEPRTAVAEQSFQFDLVSQAKLLQRFLGERIVIEQIVGDELQLVEGRLIGAGDGLTLQLDDGSVQAMRAYGNIRFPELPGGLITKPTLEWLLDSPRAGAQDTRIAYETQGMTWWADYNLTLDESDGCSLDLSPWVSVINRSGAGFSNARLKLIAGDVNRAEMPRPQREVMMRMAEDSVAAAPPAFEEKAFFEYHLYTLQRRTDLPDNSTKQIQLFNTARDIACEKELVFNPTMHWGYHGGYTLDQNYGAFGKGQVDVYLSFENKEDEGLGVPLPAGRIRVNQVDPADGSLEFIGEDTLDHTPRNETVRIEMGEAFDVVGERKQTDFQVDSRGHHLWETFEIRLRNQKKTSTKVIVLENLYRAANWEIEDNSHRFTKENSNRIRFEVEIPSEKEAVITYKVHYTW